MVGSSADVGATFTPRPAPGPCIEVLSGAAVGFGDVTVGVAKAATIETAVTNCSDGLDLDLLGSVSPAVSGSGPGAITWQPWQFENTTSPNEFVYTVSSSEPATANLGGTPTSIGTAPAGVTRYLDHRLLVSVGSSTGLNQEFRTTVTFTGVTA